jgi:hypothetical protein
MIMLTMRSGIKVPIRGERWSEIKAATLMGTISVRDEQGHNLHVRSDAVDLAAEIPQSEWDLQRAGAWVRAHRWQFWFRRVLRKLGIKSKGGPMEREWEEILTHAEKATRGCDG